MITVRTFVFNAFMVNTYILYDETNEAVIVDPACSDRQEEEQLSGFIAAHSLKPVRSLNTHLHIDHILGNAFVEETWGLRPEYHTAGAPFLITAREIAASFGFRMERIPEQGHSLQEGEMINWGVSDVQVRYTPGHADGSISLYNAAQGFVLTGDVLFRGSVGRTDLPSGNLQVLMNSIREQLYTLPDDTVVYPGHGPSTTIGYEKQHNPFVR